MTRPRFAALLAVAVISGTAALAGATAAPALADVSNEHARELARGAQVIVGTCSFEAPPTTESRCETYIILWVQAAVAERRPDLDGVPWVAEVFHSVSIERPDGTGEVVLAEAGHAPIEGSFDVRHLRSARMGAVDVVMTVVDPETGQPSGETGSTVHLGAFTWSASTPTVVWGSDGPMFDAPRHVSLPCGHLSLLAHQTVTFGSVSGAIDGRPIDDLFQLPQTVDGEPAGGAGAIFDNAFQVHSVDHCAT